MIHIFIGTKAQLIKMAPIMRGLQERGIEYNFIFSGQHKETISELRKNFGIKEPDIILHQGGDINSVPKMLAWIVKVVFRCLLNGRKIWKYDKHGIVLNHGDTFSTLLGSLLSKLYRLKNAHIESGLRSFNILHPFPEEITRLIVFRLSDYYFAPGPWALNNLAKYDGNKIDTTYNTLYDSLQIISSSTTPSNIDIPNEQYAVVTLHRFENIYHKNNLKDTIDLLLEISEEIKLLFILHNPTKRKLVKTRLINTLEEADNIELKPRQDYLSFISLIRKAEFVISDGGSNQEECYYLGKPCILFRNATEREEGLGKNVVLSNYDKNIIRNFCKDYKAYSHEESNFDTSPSNTIIDNLSDFYRSTAPNENQ